MPLTLNLGSAGSLEVSAAGDLVKYLTASANNVVNLAAALFANPNTTVADVPAGSLSTGISFSFAPSWTILQQVPITLTVQPAANCRLSVLKPGATLFSYVTDQAGDQNTVTVPDGVYYIAIELNCSLAVAAGASFSSGNWGVSGNISTQDQFRVANYYAVSPSVLLRDAVFQAFSNFVLPFHEDSIAQLPVGDYVDFEFIGKLSLGFGATYGFSTMLFGGLNDGEVKASFSTPVGKAVLSAIPSVQVGAAFKLTYAHDDAFRVLVQRTAPGVSLILMRSDASNFSTKESIGLTLNTGAKFQVDASTLKAEAQKAAQAVLGTTAGSLVGQKLAGVAGQLASDVTSSVNSLLALGDGQKIELELVQSRASTQTALFIYTFDFSAGSGAYGVAMRGDYASALSMPGVSLDPRSYIEQVYTQSAGLNLQFFSLLKYQDVTQYVQKTDVLYVGNRTFQLRESAGALTISGLFGKTREADMYFLAECRNGLGSPLVTDVGVRWNTVFIDMDAASAFQSSIALMNLLNQTSLGNRMRSYTLAQPHGTIQVTIDVDASLLDALDADAYLPNGDPPIEPHLKDKRNYEQWVAAARDLIGPDDTVAATFLNSFARYSDWLNWNRVKIDQQESTNPGDRLQTGNLAANVWPDKYPPDDQALRALTQTYLLSGQACMNLVAAIQQLRAALPGIQTDTQFAALLDSLKQVVHNDSSPFPTFFLKPTILAVLRLANASLVAAGDLPDPNIKGPFVVTLKAASTAVAAGGR